MIKEKCQYFTKTTSWRISKQLLKQANIKQLSAMWLCDRAAIPKHFMWYETYQAKPFFSSTYFMRYETYQAKPFFSSTYFWQVIWDISSKTFFSSTSGLSGLCAMKSRYMYLGLESLIQQDSNRGPLDLKWGAQPGTPWYEVRSTTGDPVIWSKEHKLNRGPHDLKYGAQLLVDDMTASIIIVMDAVPKILA